MNYFKSNVLTFGIVASSPHSANPYPKVLPDFAIPTAITSKPFFIAGQIYD